MDVRSPVLGLSISKFTVILWLANIFPYMFQGVKTALEGQQSLALSNLLFLLGFVAAFILLIRISIVGAIFSLSIAAMVTYRMVDAVLNPNWDLFFRLSHGGMIALAALFALAAVFEVIRRRELRLPQRSL